MVNLVKEVFPSIKRVIGLQTLLGAADVDLIVTSANMKVGAYTVAAQPSTPSRISASVTAVGADDTMGTLAIVGTDSSGNALSETIVPIADDIVYTTNYFATVTSVTGAGWVIGEGNDTITVGVSMESEWKIKGESITFVNLSGNIWIDPLDTAVANSTSLKLVATNSRDLLVKDSLSIISDASGGTYQIIVWEL